MLNKIIQKVEEFRDEAGPYRDEDFKGNLPISSWAQMMEDQTKLAQQRKSLHKRIIDDGKRVSEENHQINLEVQNGT